MVRVAMSVIPARLALMTASPDCDGVTTLPNRVTGPDTREMVARGELVTETVELSDSSI